MITTKIQSQTFIKLSDAKVGLLYRYTYEGSKTNIVGFVALTHSDACEKQFIPLMINVGDHPTSDTVGDPWTAQDLNLTLADDVEITIKN